MLFRKNNNIEKLKELNHKLLLFEAENSFKNVQFDEILFKKYFGCLHISPAITNSFLTIQKLAIEANCAEPWSVQKEIGYIRHYLNFWKALDKENFEYQFTIKLENEEVFLQPFILLPLIQNSLYFGYHSMAQFPVKIDLRIIANRLSLIVSNRVNHHIVNQDNTAISKLFKSRLILNYPNHQLISNSNSTLFRANLMVKLNEE